MFENPYIEDRLKKIEAAKVLSKAGGKARAKALSPERRSQIAMLAAQKRWASNAC